MPQELTTYAKNTMLDCLFRNITTGLTASVFVSAHTASPGLTGANEVSGGAPAYARKAITFNAATAGAVDSSNTPVLDIPASTTVAFVGIFNALTVGNFLAQDDITDEVFGSQGTLTFTDADVDLNNDPA